MGYFRVRRSKFDVQRFARGRRSRLTQACSSPWSALAPDPCQKRHCPRAARGTSRVTTPSPTSAHPWPARLLAVAAVGALAVTLAHPSATRQFTWPWLPGLTLAWIVPLFALLSRRTPWRAPDRLLTSGLLLLALGTFVAAALSPFAPLSLPRV